MVNKNYIWLISMVNVGKYTIHGSYGISRKSGNLMELVRLLTSGVSDTPMSNRKQNQLLTL